MSTEALDRSVELDALNEALEVAKGQAGLARAVGVSQPSVWHWLHKSKRVPAEFVIPVETATGVPRERLRPDLFSNEPPAQATAA